MPRSNFTISILGVKIKNTKYTMDSMIYLLMKTNKDYTKSTKIASLGIISQSINRQPISRWENLKMLSKNSSHGALLSYWIQQYTSIENNQARMDPP